MFFKILRTLFLIFLCWEYVCRCCLVSTAVDPSEAKLVFYYGPQFIDSLVYNLSDATDILNNKNFDINKETHLYLHGFQANQTIQSTQDLVNAYLKRKTVNLIALDWAKAAGVDLTTVALINIEALAPVVAEVILNLYNAGMKREKFQVVAHSMGAQLAGMIGRQVMKKTNGKMKIYRMTALDAALPFFQPYFLRTVNKLDAEFLQAIHTDIAAYGQPYSIGHVDFWPNGGLQGQPGCPQGFIVAFSSQDLCSHMRAIYLWAETVATRNISETKFLAFPSSNYLQFEIDGVKNLENKPIEMGIDCPMDARGDYYLKTNSMSPFAMGMNGY